MFHNGSNYDYHFIIKELAEEFKKQFTCLGENTEKYITFTVPIEKEVTRIGKNGKEITFIYYTYILHFIFYQLSAQNLWQGRYQMLLKIYLKNFIKLKVNLKKATKNVKHVELNISIATVFLNTKILKII